MRSLQWMDSALPGPAMTELERACQTTCRSIQPQVDSYRVIGFEVLRASQAPLPMYSNAEGDVESSAALLSAVPSYSRVKVTSTPRCRRIMASSPGANSSSSPACS